MTNPNKLERLNAFINEREALCDWSKFMSKDKTMLIRQLLYKHCNFPRSTLYQNSDIKKRIAALESDLRQRKLLTTQATVSLDDIISSAADFDLEQQIDLLEARLRIACERLQETKSHLESFRPADIKEMGR